MSFTLNVDIDGLAEEVRSYIWDSLASPLSLKFCQQGDYLSESAWKNLAQCCPLIFVLTRRANVIADHAHECIQITPVFEIHYFSVKTDGDEPGRILGPALSSIINLWQYPWDRWPRTFAAPVAGMNVSWAAPSQLAIVDDLASLDTPILHAVLELQVRAEFYARGTWPP